MIRWYWDWAKYHDRHSSKSIRVTKLFFCQNGVLLGRSFWPKDSLVTLVRFFRTVIKNIQECAFSIWSVCQMVSRTFIQRIDEFFKWFFFLELECSIVIKFSKKNAIISSNTLSFKKDALNNFEFVKTGFIDSVFDPTSSLVDVDFEIIMYHR